MDITNGVSPSVKLELLGQGGKGWRFYLRRPEELDMMNDFQAAHVYHNPEDVSLSHEGAQSAPAYEGKPIKRGRAASLVESTELNKQDDQDREGRYDVRVVQAGEEEKDGE